MASVLAACGIQTESNPNRTTLIPNPPAPKPTATENMPPLIHRVIAQGEQTIINSDTPDYIRDVIPREKLWSEYHTQILNAEVADTNFVRLLIREGALTTEPFLSLKDSNDTLTICLLNGPLIQPKYLLPNQEQAHSEIRTVLTNTVEKLVANIRKEIAGEKADTLTEFYMKRHEEYSKFQNGEINQDEYEVFLKALEYRYEAYLTPHPTNEAVLRRILGVYDYVINAKGGKDKYIFLPVRDMPFTSFRVGKEARIAPHQTRFPRTNESFPNPNFLELDKSQPEYPLVKGNTPGTNLRHELYHAAGVEHPENDLKLVEDIRNGQLNYVFQTPEGYIVTKTPSSQAA